MFHNRFVLIKLFFKISSERFLVKISKEGFSNYIEKLHNNCTIFTVSYESLAICLLYKL